jgi:hypothetical protein
VPGSPPGPAREPQGGSTITLAIRTPEARRPIFRLFPEEPSAPRVYSPPPRLAEKEGRGKRKRAYTDRKKAVKDGGMDESQHRRLHGP